MVKIDFPYPRCMIPSKMSEDQNPQRESPTFFRREDGVVKFDLDQLPPGRREETEAFIAEKSELPRFRGDVEYGYPLSRVLNHGICPRCGAATSQQVAEFIYATSRGSRAAIAPAGRFCSDCPTVIVDQHMIEEAMVVDGRFFRTVGVLDKVTGDPMYFKTWRGEKPTYFLDENEQIEDMRIPSDAGFYEGGPTTPGISAPRAFAGKKKRKRKQAKANRKRNRKRK